MSDPTETIVSLLDGWFGGAATTLIGAFMGRAMWHATEVRKGNRKMFGREVIWELPIAVGMALIGEGIGTYMQFSHPISTAIVASLAYFGPRGTEILFTKWFGSKINKGE